jgi:hypothetical protein
MAAISFSAFVVSADSGLASTSGGSAKHSLAQSLSARPTAHRGDRHG